MILSITHTITRAGKTPNVGQECNAIIYDNNKVQETTGRYKTFQN